LSLDEFDAGGNPAEVPIRPLVSPAAGVKLWWCGLRPSAASLAACEATLSDAERARAARFGTSALRERYVMGRGALRRILGAEIGTSAGKVPIVRGLRGRPQLAGATNVDFNVSHTEAVAIVGLVRNARVGVDVERLDRTINVAGIARKFLTPIERSELAALPADEARRRVLTLWTCKEAMSKATGDALAAPFDRIDVALADRAMLRAGPDVYLPRHWTLHRASAPLAYIATVALWRPE